MIIKTMKSLKRAPVRAVAVLLFAAVITMIICSLQASNEAELRNYEEAYQAVPVTVTVTEPSGTNGDDFFIENWVWELFTEKEPIQILDLSEAENDDEVFDLLVAFYDGKLEATEISLAEYLTDIEVQIQWWISTINGNSYIDAAGTPMLIGINSVSGDKRLLPEYGCEITWYEGYDESIFKGDEAVCLIPEDMAKPRFYNNGKDEAVLYFEYELVQYGKVVRYREYNCTLKIVGTYTAGDEKSIYCPVPIVEQVMSEFEDDPMIYSMSATIADNRRLDEFREKMSLCFVEPSPDAKMIPWGDYLYSNSLKSVQEYYKYALDINDENLFDLSSILEDSIKFNQTVTIFVVALSVVAGFLVGFLMIRRRKREIMLMRMVGESNARVYVGFALEQMICIILGIAIGGAYYNWNPMDKLAIFAIAYFVALSFALVIFMSKKLIKNVKEDE
ncbi:MAG: ABC transporter permease [Clostridia bacterium]|nr:ABC transporter permease [Clostridia bacterium]